MHRLVEDLKGDDPLTHGHFGQYAIDKMSRSVRHATAATGGTEASAFARKRDQAFLPTSLAPHPCKAMAEQSAGEKRAQLSFYKARNQPCAIGDAFEKRLEFRLDRAVENALFGLMSLVAVHGRNSAGPSVIKTKESVYLK